jgi:hypothetical protein
MLMLEATMTTIETTQIAGADKLVHLTIPVEEPNRRYHMLIVVTPEPDKTDAGTDAKDWPVGYFENVIGSIKDESFFRHPQGEYEKRLEMK